jgi:hypothetical protein
MQADEQASTQRECGLHLRGTPLLRAFFYCVVVIH